MKKIVKKLSLDKMQIAKFDNLKTIVGGDGGDNTIGETNDLGLSGKNCLTIRNTKPVVNPPAGTVSPGFGVKI